MPKHTEEIEVPKNTGRKGFLHVIDQILQLDRVQGITIDARGKISYTRYVAEGFAPETLDIGPKISFETLMPYACVRNSPIDEVTIQEKYPSRSITQLFQCVSNERLYPIAFVTGAHTTLWEWFSSVENLVSSNKTQFQGLPILTDRYVEDYVLILAAAHGRDADITEVQKSFKIVMPQRRSGELVL